MNRKPPKPGTEQPSPDSPSETGVNALVAGEGGERRRREPGEGVSSIRPSPALTSLGHPLPQRETEKRICVARVGAAHGVRGAVRLWPFTEDPLAIEDYGALSDKNGARVFEIDSLRAAKDHLVATFKGVSDRNAAERLNGVELYVARAALPDTEAGEYYHADLIGLAAIDASGASLGRVLAMHDFGAGDIIEIAPPSGPTLMLPFTDAVVPTVDLTAGHVVIVRPGEIEGDDQESA